MQTTELNICLVAVFSMLFGRQNKFPTFTYFFPLYMFRYLIRLLTTILKALHWGCSLAQIFLHGCFFVYHVHTAQSVFNKNIVTLWWLSFCSYSFQSDENNGTISYSHCLLFHQFFSSTNFIKHLIPPCLSVYMTYNHPLLGSRTLDSFCSLKELVNAWGILMYLHM